MAWLFHDEFDRPPGHAHARFQAHMVCLDGADKGTFGVRPHAGTKCAFGIPCVVHRR